MLYHLHTKGWFTPWTIKLDHGRWPFSMVWFDGLTSMVWFLTKINYKAFGPLTWCKPHVDQEEWPCIKKWMCWFFLIYAQKGRYWINSNITVILSSLSSLLFTSQKKPLKCYYNNVSLPWALAISYHNTSFTSPTTKPIGLCHWIM